MRNWIVAGLAALGALALASCETMSAEECAAADWRALGFADGSGGGENFARRQESCARKGFGADMDAYRIGNADGIRQYCTLPGNGFQRGLSGAAYAGFCPAPLHDQFSRAHADGFRAYQLRTALSNAESKQRDMERHRTDIDEEITRNEDALRAATTREERERIHNELGRLNDERERLNDDLSLQLREVRFRSNDVQQFHDQIGDRWGAW